MGERLQHDDVIEMEEAWDPDTGQSFFRATPTGEVAIRDGRLETVADEDAPATQTGVRLTTERFAAGPVGDDPWAAAEQAQDAGQEARIVDGRLVFGPPEASADDAPGNAVKLTGERFAALRTDPGTEIRRLATSGAASQLVDELKPTSDLRDYFATNPGGFYLRTKPSRHGDVLHAVIRREPSTGLYLVHLWAFMKREGSELRRTDLNSWVGTSTSMSAHRLHLYPGSGRHGAVLCLSERTHGGMPDLTSAVLQAAKWAAGMGEVVRGRSFPYRQQGDR